MSKKITFPYYLEVSEQYSIVFTQGSFGTISQVVFDQHRGVAHDLRLSRPSTDIKVPVFVEGDIEVFQLSSVLLFLRMGQYHYKMDDAFRRTKGMIRTLQESQNATYPVITKEAFEGYRLLYQKMGKREESSFGEILRQPKPLSQYVKGLEVVLKDKPTDFTITSNDEGSFQVHSFLLTNLWPFFSTASSVEMIEKDTQTLNLPFPKICVEILVSFFYGKDVGAFSWDSAMLLLKMSALYDIPKLKTFATESILNSTELLTLERAIQAWKVANESDAAEVETFAAAFLKKHVPEIEDSEESKDMTESQLLELLLHVVRV